jgi:hypothetical protein
VALSAAHTDDQLAALVTALADLTEIPGSAEIPGTGGDHAS